MLAISKEFNSDVFDDVEFKVQHYDYSAFGKILSIKDGNGNDVTDAPPVVSPFTFTGREWDAESGLYYYRSRSYDPNIGRFLQADPAAGLLTLPITHINKYIYCGNSPINKLDPFGRSFWGEVGGFFGGRGGWGTDVLTAVAVVAVIYFSGGTAAGAMIAVASAAGGAAVAAGAMAAFQGGNFWSNFSNNFHTDFRISAAFLAGGAIAADVSGSGVGLAGGNGLQGYVVSNQSMGLRGGLTIGSSAVLSGSAPSTSLDAAGTKLGAHEFGHTLQFIGLSGVSGLFGTGQTGAWGAYLGLGLLGTSSAGTWWENSASTLGSGQ